MQANIYGYVHLYDALKLYSLAARAALNETGNPNVTTDGRFIWNKMRRMTFSGNVTEYRRELEPRFPETSSSIKMSLNNTFFN